MVKTKFPIIVQKNETHDEGRKSYNIYCMAPFVNAFNEVIHVTFDKGDPHAYSAERKKDRWGASKGSSGSSDPVETKLTMEGYAIALKLMAGDESVVTPKALVKKFLARYYANLKARERRNWEARRKYDEKQRKEAQAEARKKEKVVA